MFGQMQCFHRMFPTIHIHGEFQRKSVDIVLVEKLTHETVANLWSDELVRQTREFDHLRMIGKALEHAKTPWKFLLRFGTSFASFQLKMLRWKKTAEKRSEETHLFNHLHVFLKFQIVQNNGHEKREHNLSRMK
jgi:hypothetical protein